MLIKGIQEEDFTNYKKTSMFIIFPYCDFKCDKENGTQLCQNWSLSKQAAWEVPIDTIVQHYISNPITHAIVCAGLEPFKSFPDLLELVDTFRKVTDDDIVIFTGYNEHEIKDEIQQLQHYKNIIVKFGRFRPGQKVHYDETLGINLISDNQYGKRLS